MAAIMSNLVLRPLEAIGRRLDLMTAEVPDSHPLPDLRRVGTDRPVIVPVYQHDETSPGTDTDQLSRPLLNFPAPGRIPPTFPSRAGNE